MASIFRKIFNHWAVKFSDYAYPTTNIYRRRQIFQTYHGTLVDWQIALAGAERNKDGTYNIYEVHREAVGHGVEERRNTISLNNSPEEAYAALERKEKIYEQEVASTPARLNPTVRPAKKHFRSYFERLQHDGKGAKPAIAFDFCKR
jgi:hypothetical protein